MDSLRMLSAVIITIIILIFVMKFVKTPEGFANKEEKAEAITNWFNKNPNPKYSIFKEDLNKKSNIVEYDAALSLSKKGSLDKKTLIKHL